MKKLLSVMSVFSITVPTITNVVSCDKKPYIIKPNENVVDFPYNVESEKDYNDITLSSTLYYLQENPKLEKNIRYFNVFNPEKQLKLIKKETGANGEPVYKMNLTINDTFGVDGDQIWFLAWYVSAGLNEFFELTKKPKLNKNEFENNDTKVTHSLSFTCKKDQSEFCINFVQYTFLEKTKNKPNIELKLIASKKVQLIVKE